MKVLYGFKNKQFYLLNFCKKAINMRNPNVTNVPHILKVIKDLGNKSVRAIFLREKI